MSRDFSKVIEAAEKQVAGIQNEKLKEIAFSKLLNLLLDDDTIESDKEESRSPKKGKAKRAKRKSSHSKGRSDGPKGWIEELIVEKFFSKPKSSADIREELETRSHHLSATDITRPLEALCHEKKLRRKKVAPEDGSKAVLHWVNW